MSLLNLLTHYFSETISPCNVSLCYVRVYQRNPDQGILCVIIIHFSYLIVGPYYSNSRRQQTNMSVVKFLYMIVLWFVYTVIRFPNIMVWKYFRISTIPNISLSVVVYFICAGVNLCD